MQSETRRRNRWGMLVVPLVGWLSAAVFGQSKFWDGGGANPNFGTAQNWTDDTLPAADTAVGFGSAYASGDPTLDADYSFGRIVFSASPQVTFQTTSSANDLTLNAAAGFNNADGVIRVFNSDFTHVVNSNIILKGSPGSTVFWSSDNDVAGFRYNSGIRRTGALIAHDLSGSPTTHELTSGNNFFSGVGAPFLFDFSGAPAVGASDGTVNHRLVSNGRLRFSNTNQISGKILMEGGVIQWTGAGEFTMSRGSGAGQWDVTNGTSGGWAAVGADRTVNSGGAGATITTNFTPIFGSGDATHTVILKNPMTRTGDFTLRTIDGPAAVEGRLLGAITLGAGQDANFIGNGTVELAVANSITAGRVNVAGGTVLVNLPAALGSSGLVYMMNSNPLHSSVTGNAFLLTNGAMTIPNPIQLSTVNPNQATIGGNTADSSTFSGNITMGISGAKNLNVSAAVGGTVTFSGVLDEPTGSANLTKTGAGRVILSNTNAYVGTTTVAAGTLLVNGSIASSSGVIVNAGATLGGSGTVSAISGAGTVAPGSSPGILTASSIDGSAGTDFVFEFTQTGSPTYATPAASGNDALRLTSGTPFTTALGAGNVVDVFFNVPSTVPNDLVGQTFRGGFFTDATGDFLASVSGANFVYHHFSGTLFPHNVTLSTVPDNGGRVLQFTVLAVPEPATLGLFLLGGLVLRRRV